jgi:hypothetical protein
MNKAKYTACLLISTALILLLSLPSLAAPATVKKTVQALDDGSYQIKFVVTASKADIYAFMITDPKGSLVDVYAAKGWCILTDGELSLARTGTSPITTKRSIEFIVYASSPDAQFVWTFFGPVNQLGKGEVL